MTAPVETPANKKKIIVAVHGIGNQTNFDTIQSTLFQFCKFHGAPAAVSLGRFHTEQGWLDLKHPPFPEAFSNLIFAEVYWANIPRKNASEYTLEETQKWAKTILERVHQQQIENHNNRAANPGKPILREEDFPLLDQVLKEMLQTISVLDHLCFLADKAGIFTFDLNKVLIDYLADVQVVAEFDTLRQGILKAFDDVMEKVHKDNLDAEIYIIAHSEGTIVSLLGLLKAMSNTTTPAWLDKVRGFMTIGSPIDKHLILWPELFEQYANCKWTPAKKEDAIKWHNYYDRGDPIGFDLNSIREWLKENREENPYLQYAFQFEDNNDFGFTRYPLPGKAHVDYWTDDAVFGHFIQNVVGEKLPAPVGSQKAPDYSKPPTDKRVARYLSYLLPYGLAMGLLFLAVFVIYKASNAYLYPPENGDSAKSTGQVKTSDTANSNNQGAKIGTGTVFKDVLAFTLLLAGLTIVTRIPRLTRAWGWRLLGILLFAVSAIGYWLLRGNGHYRLIVVASAVAAIITLIYLIYTFRHQFPPIGIKLTLSLGMIGIASIIGNKLIDLNFNAGSLKDIVDLQTDPGPLWPLLLASALFLYLWWLVILLFDLIFIWHCYIRNSQAINCLRSIGQYKEYKTA
jgi:hypothetical protein